jgi:GTP cyclohydrolase I
MPTERRSKNGGARRDGASGPATRTPTAETPPVGDAVRAILRAIGEDPDREGLRRTPDRVSRAVRDLTAGYALDAGELLRQAVFESDTDEMVVVKDIEVYSLCEHHLLPFFGRAHVAYLPKGRIVGLSKLPRVVDVFAKRLQVQERLTTQIANAVAEALAPIGVGVVVEAQHLCMMMRGVSKQNSVAVTSCMLGRFRSDAKTRAEFLQFIRHA